MNKSMYADEINRKYPLNTVDATLTSFKHFCVDKANMDKAASARISDKFNKAGAFYGIKLEKLSENCENFTKSANISVKSGIFKVSDIKKAEDVEQAADFVIEKRASMPRQELKDVARHILKSAAILDIDLNSERMAKLNRIAGFGVGDRAEIEEEFNKRASMNHFPESGRSAFMACCKELRELTDEEFYKSANLERICDTLEAVDHMYNNDKYSEKFNKVAAPEDIVFKNSIEDLIKEGSDHMYIPSIESTISKKALLERKESVNAFLKQAYGHDFDEQDMLDTISAMDGETASALFSEIN